MANPPDVEIRPLTPADQPFLWECLYFAIYVPVGTPPPGLEILDRPDLSKYVADWGRPTDSGFLAFNPSTGVNLGAIWLRQFTANNAAYGFVAENIPELGMAVVPDFRGKGLGTKLMERVLAAKKHPAISLSVSPKNPALKLYERFDFKKVGEKGDSWTMLWKEKS